MFQFEPGPTDGGHARRCGIVLAAGEGMRLRPLVSRLIGEILPKQYVSFVGRRSMLEHTLQRVERLIPRERLFTVVSESHLQQGAALRQIASRPPETVVIQPDNRDTGPGLLLPLVRLQRRYPEALVAVFPSDHFILEEDRFMAHVAIAFRFVEDDPSRIVLLGVKPDGPETEYGYILQEEEQGIRATPGLRGVARFVEKPPPEQARDLVARGGLWNTLVMIFRAETFLELVRAISPSLGIAFDDIARAIGTAGESERVREIYRRMPPVNLSRDLLENLPLAEPSRLAVLAVRGVQWSDWGSEARVLETLRTGLPVERRSQAAGALAASSSRIPAGAGLRA